MAATQRKAGLGPALVGRSVEKEFCNPDTLKPCVYDGTVTSYDPTSCWYDILYEDGDAEQLSHSDVIKILKPDPLPPPASPQKAAKRRKPPAAEVRKVVRIKSNLDARKATVPQPASCSRLASSPTESAAVLATAVECMPAAAGTAECSSVAQPAAATSKCKLRSSSQATTEGDGAVQADVLRPLAVQPAAGSEEQPQQCSVAGKPKKQPRKAKGAGAKGIAVQAVKKALDDRSPAVSVPEVSPGQELVWRTGSEPWRALGVEVHEEELITPQHRKSIDKCIREFYKHHRMAVAMEEERYNKTNGRDAETDNALSKRPDRVAQTLMVEEGRCINRTMVAGHVPGLRVGDRFYTRAELACLGYHFPPLAGIDFTNAARKVQGISFAVSIICSGCYEDDEDDGETIWYTGQGGNNLLGNKRQVRDQHFKSGNKALVGNIRLGVPVRVTRKNKDPGSVYGLVYTYDGLYDVVEYRITKGESGFDVFKYRLKRRPGQGPLLSQLVKFGGASAPRDLNPLTRPGICDTDISGGLEAIQVPAMNEVDDELPPCTDLARVPQVSDLIGVSSRHTDVIRDDWQPTMMYSIEYDLRGLASPAIPRVPKTYTDPHDYIKVLNKGQLPYVLNKNGKHRGQIKWARAVVYECGPWAHCTDGEQCKQRVTQKGLQYRLEVFKTRNGRGWGVRSWDLIPAGGYITTFTGEVHRHADIHALPEDSYIFDLGKRTDMDVDNNILTEPDKDQEVKFVVDAYKCGSVARFLNHSCDPNCFIQPVLSDHHDLFLTKICIFAAKNIPPFTELTYDYSGNYVESNLDGQCMCGALTCVSAAS